MFENSPSWFFGKANSETYALMYFRHRNDDAIFARHSQSCIFWMSIPIVLIRLVKMLLKFSITFISGELTNQSKISNFLRFIKLFIFLYLFICSIILYLKLSNVIVIWSEKICPTSFRKISFQTSKVKQFK